MPPNDRYLTLDTLRKRIEDGEIDTVVLAFTDMQGRLQGKRLHAQYFLDDVLEHGTEGCNYLLAVDVDMNTVDGYAISSWERGYGDFEFVPDWRHARALLPHLPATRARAVRPGLAGPRARSPQSPRTILRTPARRGRRARLDALVGTELEFIVFDDDLRAGRTDSTTAASTPVNQYNVDYSILGTSRVEPLLRDIRNHDVRRRHARRVGEGRVQPRPARDRASSTPRRWSPPTTTASTRRAPRRSPPSTASR